MKVFICDAGAFGTAMAIILARAGHEVSLLIQPFDQKHKDMFYNIKYGAQRRNYLHLPGAELPKMEFTDNFEDAKSAEIVLLCVPSRYIWGAFFKMKSALAENPKAIIALLTKGLDDFVLLPLGIKMQYCLEMTRNYNFAVISGGTPAQMLIDQYKTFVASVASANLNVIQKTRRLFLGTNLATVGTTDIAGVSWGGALKNAYAIKYGMLSGLGQPDLAWEYVNTLALREIKIFLDYSGAQSKTLYSPAVSGDFRITCVGYLGWESRNVSFGKFLALRPTKEAITRYISEHTVEGYESTITLRKISQKEKLKTPILDEIYSICASASPC